MHSNAFFCSTTAAQLYGAPLPRQLEGTGPLHVANLAPARAPEGRGIAGHQITVRDDVRERHGLRVSSPERTWCDLGAVLSVENLVAVGDFLIHHELPMSSAEALTYAITTTRVRRGVGRLTEAVSLLDNRAESRRESLLRVALMRQGITGLSINHWIVLPGVHTRYRADLALVELKIAIEYQGEHHHDLEEWRKDMTRKSRLRAHNWYVFEVNLLDLDDPAELAQRLRLVIEQRARALALG